MPRSNWTRPRSRSPQERTEMAIDTGLASLSETLWAAATGTYMLAVVGYTGEYAFGRRGRIAKTAPVAVAEPALVTVGGTAPALPEKPEQPAAPIVPSSVDSGRRWGRFAVALTILG